MFGRLAQYDKNLEYLKAHAFIDFSTLWHQERYVVFAVLDVSLDIGDDRFVEYFAHPTFKSDEEFERYIRRVELASLYAIPMDVKPTDALLTLSTCLDEDRLVILARRQREGEKTASLREIVNMAVRQGNERLSSAKAAEGVVRPIHQQAKRSAENGKRNPIRS